jgi:ferritin-like protein
MSDYHEPWDALPQTVRDATRALTSLKEEIEAVGWYDQRVAVATDPELAAVLAHNRDEEIEHACMTLEWLRRNMAGWDEQLRTYLFTDGPITTAEERATAAAGEASAVASPAAAPARPSASLGIGSLKGTTT